MKTEEAMDIAPIHPPSHGKKRGNDVFFNCPQVRHFNVELIKMKTPIQIIFN